MPETSEPDYTASTEELYQMAVTTGESVDTAWATAANDVSVDASAPTYGCKASSDRYGQCESFLPVVYM